MAMTNEEEQAAPEDRHAGSSGVDARTMSLRAFVAGLSLGSLAWLGGGAAVVLGIVFHLGGEYREYMLRSSGEPIACPGVGEPIDVAEQIKGTTWHGEEDRNFKPPPESMCMCLMFRGFSIVSTPKIELPPPRVEQNFSQLWPPFKMLRH